MTEKSVRGVTPLNFGNYCIISMNCNLKDLDLRAMYNVHIIAIKKPTPESFVLVPPADYEIQATDTLLIL
jgi:uncharacterized protein with PhoU and TrkA domain